MFDNDPLSIVLPILVAAFVVIYVGNVLLQFFGRVFTGAR